MTILEKLGFGPTRSHTRTDRGWVVEVRPPQWSHFAPSKIVLTDDQFVRYQRWLEGGRLIQQALPDLNDDQREILMTGIGPDEWEEIISDDN